MVGGGGGVMGVGEVDERSLLDEGATWLLVCMRVLSLFTHHAAVLFLHVCKRVRGEMAGARERQGTTRRASA